LLRSFRGVLSRPVALARRDGRVHVVLVERREGAHQAPLRAELLARLKDCAQDHPARSMRELAFVHRVLGRDGWAGVEAQDPRVLRLAVDQIEKLRGRRTSDFLEAAIARLRAAWWVAAQRDPRRSDGRDQTLGHAAAGAATGDAER
jgi:hypothetical protein